MKENKLFKKTILYDNHIQLGAKIISYSGYYMPLQYFSSLKEHMAVRNSIGLFDISHMGKFILEGINSNNLLQYLTSNDVSKIKPNQAQYSCLINHYGGIIDDLIIYKISEKKFLLIVNAINIEKNKIWIKKYIKNNINFIDVTQEYSLLSIQGPKTFKLIQKLTNIPLNKIPYFHFKIGKFAGINNIFISNTGYTGSSGIEIYIHNKYAKKIWNEILSTNLSIIPCGIASRDSLRLEMGYRLYGKDISEETSPIEAGLSWITKFNKKFIAKKILQKQKKKGTKKKFISFIIEKEKVIPRSGYLLKNKNNCIIGKVTSGNFSPILKKGIGLAYIENNHQLNHIFFTKKNKNIPIKLVKLPFIQI
ncbi:glycine cleavage system aminomethyltransferase GcvT [Blattabacterium cuenoti]|uniref:glycine cleavage system aminomethyltransferase GcvT n=1 Tax=Blattabacterium cuenoti TaxID=1653831 RepID=UPI00163C4E9A|nr:glycine cleavage system aminomethyltransferase GcvT [Blattabacterium cuenoti]